MVNAYLVASSVYKMVNAYLIASSVLSTCQTPSNLTTRGYSEDQYSWLLNDFKKIWGDAVESIPDDVKNWAGDGQRIAAKRMQGIADYARPRLATMGKTMGKWHEVLSASAEESMNDFVPKLVPALQVLVAEVQDTLELAREVIPPVAVGGRVVYDEVSPVFSNIVTSAEDVVREKVMPAVEDARHQASIVGKTVQTSVRDVIKSTLDTVFDVQLLTLWTSDTTGEGEEGGDGGGEN